MDSWWLSSGKSGNYSPLITRMGIVKGVGFVAWCVWSWGSGDGKQQSEWPSCLCWNYARGTFPISWSSLSCLTLCISLTVGPRKTFVFPKELLFFSIRIFLLNSFFSSLPKSQLQGNVMLVQCLVMVTVSITMIGLQISSCYCHVTSFSSLFWGILRYLFYKWPLIFFSLKNIRIWIY